MAKVNPWNLPRPERHQETRTFRQGDIEIPLTFREPDAGDIARAGEVARSLGETYLHGSEMRAAAPFPDPDVKVSDALFMACALAAECQPPDGQDNYTALEFVLISSRAPAVWAAATRWVNTLTEKWQSDQGNAPGAPTASSAARRSI